ncbi:hypothetical protein [Fredinandcohnia sp. 179-A 10B2 NHS]|uniref:hypothetical protein n=1 Tax=Fredinandcohnia sp. 179-A 10B2 NHS TaxID=3235176 RepID=UPI0039A33E06
MGKKESRKIVKVNPVIVKARQEGYDSGYLNGSQFGFEQGKYSACMFIASKFEGLEKVKGIGPKTMKLIVEHMGAEYFQEVKK